MARTIGAIVAGVAFWLIVGTALNLAARYGWPAYGAAYPTRSADTSMFDDSMRLARLLTGGALTVAMGFVVGRIAPKDSKAVLVAGVILLLGIVLVHMQPRSWHHYPVWYHLTAFAGLVPLTLLGGRLAGSRHLRAG